MKNSFEAVVESGMGKGALFLSMPHYAQAFEKILGRKPFAGTLNARVSVQDAEKILGFKNQLGERVEGFSEGGKKLGGLTFLKAEVFGIGCLLVFPDKTTHEEGVLELVCGESLRKRLLLKDGHKIVVELSE